MTQANPKRRHRKLRLALMVCPVVIIAIVLAIGSIPQGPLVITPPPASAEPGRWMHIEGAANTRDAGGYA